MKILAIATISLMVVGCSQQSNEARDNNLCDINLNKISNYKAEFGVTTGEPELGQIRTLYQSAQDYKKTGDIKNCISSSEQALAIINNIANNN